MGGYYITFHFTSFHYITLHYITHHYMTIFSFSLFLSLSLSLSFSHTLSSHSSCVREKIFSKLLTAREKLIKLELSIQDFLLLGPVRLLPLGDRAFSWGHENDSLFDRVLFRRAPARNIPPCFSLLFSVRCRLVFRSRVIKCIAIKNNG